MARTAEKTDANSSSQSRIKLMTRVAIFPGFILLLLTILVVIVLIKLFWKRPSVAAVIVLVVLSCLVFAYLFLGVSHQRTLPVYQRAHPVAEPLVRSAGPSAAIWLPGVEDEFEANIYPSKLSAARSLALRIDEPIRQLFGSQEWPDKGIVFESGHDRTLLEEFIKTAARKFSQIQWTIEPETVTVQPDEVGITLDFSVSQTGRPPWAVGDSSDAPLISKVTSGTCRASALYGNRRISLNAEFVEKPWIENFYGVWNSRPNKRLIIAKSSGSCLTGQEAERQAIVNACNQLTPLLRQTPRAQATPSLTRKVTPNDVLERGFILDRFSQKFDGRAGEIWRHALLIDASPDRMEQLAARKVVVARIQRWNWARMILSVAGLLALITVTYVFLNAATKGYYTWSLRIAGVVLAVAVIILFVV